MSIPVENCKGCGGLFLPWEISEDGYCEGCQYQADANADHITGVKENES